MRRGVPVLALTLSAALAGCGQTGALYLPDEGTSTPVQIRPIGATAAPAATPAPAAVAPDAAAPSDGTTAAPQDDEKKPPAVPAAATAPPQATP